MSRAALVFGTFERDFFVVPRFVAEYRTTLNKALASSSTWSELLEHVETLSIEQLCDGLNIHEEDFDPDDPVDLEQLAENNFPPVLGSVMTEWFADEGLEQVIDSYISLGQSALGYEIPSIDIEHGPVIVQRLRELGYDCSEDRDLIRSAL